MFCADAVVVGAGIWGCTVARRLAEARRCVLVVEKRATVGGNVRCEIDPETGIEVHVHGSHIFHTHDRKVWDFVRRFTAFNGYQHKVLANYQGKAYHLPIGLTLINKFFGVELRPGEVEAFLTEERRRALFDAFFRGYTSKQWGQSPEEVDPNIIRRLPVRRNYDTNYFADYWQGIPADGYNTFFERLLKHPNIVVRCNAECRISDTGLQVNGERAPEVPVYYSGPLDALFGYKFGPLPWRSLRFEVESLPLVDFQGTAVVNYTEANVPYTRIHEFKHYHPEATELMQRPKTIIMREYPQAWQMGDEPYYPIKSPESTALLMRYRQELSSCPHKVIVGGRLGGYRYYDMDQAMAAALEVTDV